MALQIVLPIEIRPTASNDGYVITDANGVEHFFYYENGKLAYDGNCVPLFTPGRNMADFLNLMFDDAVLVELLEHTLITHELQMRVYKEKNRFVRIEVCVNHSTVLTLYEYWNIFSKAHEKAVGVKPYFQYKDIKPDSYEELN